MEALLPDITIFASAAVFFIAYLVLKNLLFVPYLALLDQRDQATGSEHGNIDAMTAQVKQLETQIERTLQEAQKEARLAREQILLAADQEINQMVLSAQNDAKSRIELTKQELANTQENMLKQLHVELPSLADAATKKLMAV